MTLNEAKEILEAKIIETKKIIEETPNGDKLLIKTSITYMDSSLNESDEFEAGKSSSILANVIIRDAEHQAEEDPEFYYTIATNIKGEEILDPSKLEKEYLEFDSRVIEFTDKLKKTSDTAALVAKECANIEEEGRQMVAKFEASLKALKKRGIIGALLLAGLLAIIIVLKITLG